MHPRSIVPYPGMRFWSRTDLVEDGVAEVREAARTGRIEVSWNCDYELIALSAQFNALAQCEPMGEA
jgi:hypothetical protein